MNIGFLLGVYGNSLGQSPNLRRHVLSQRVQRNQHQHSGCDNHGADEAHHTEPAQPLEGLNEEHGKNQHRGPAHCCMETADTCHACTRATCSLLAGLQLSEYKVLT